MADHAVIIPVYGQSHYTDAVLEDLYKERHLVDVYVVDNMGDYKSDYSNVAVLRPGENLGWCRGTNYGWQEAAKNRKYYGYFLMNNDVRLSEDFCAQIIQSANWLQADLMAPLYNDVWEHQKGSFGGPAHKFKPQNGHREVPFVDFTCAYVPDRTFKKIGMLDDENFWQYGWGCDFDYALRVRSLGGFIAVTFGAYLEHAHQGTAKHMDNYEGKAGAEMNHGLTAKYGVGWQTLLGGLD